jgi:hypothetical protein
MSNNESKVHSNCSKCYRIPYCHIIESYIEFETNKIITCPCFKCIVKPMCMTSMITACVCLREYDWNRYRNSYRTELHKHKSDICKYNCQSWSDICKCQS